MKTVQSLGISFLKYLTQNCFLVAMILLVQASLVPLHAATITWTGSASTAWMNSTNWSPTTIPTNTDTVIINSGTVVFATNSQFATLNFNGGFISGPVNVASNAVLNWNTGRFSPGASVQVTTNGLLNFLTGGQKELGGPLTNYGRVVWAGGSLYMMNNSADYLGKVVNLGLWQLQGDFHLGQWFGGDASTFANGSVFRKASGTGTHVINAPFYNVHGTLHVQSGTLRFDQGQQLDGLFIADTSSAIDFRAGTFAYTPLTRLTGNGQFYLSGGTLTGLSDYLPNFQLVGGSVSLSPNYQTNGSITRLDLSGATLISSNRVSGVLNFYSGNIAAPITLSSNATLNWYSGRFAPGSSLVIESNGVANWLSGGQKELGGGMTNYGQVIWNGGHVYVMNDSGSFLGTIENMPGALWDVQGNLTMNQYWAYNYASFRNRGTLLRSSGTGTATMDLPFFNLGTLKQRIGSMNFGRDLSLTTGTVVFGISSGSSFGQIDLSGTVSFGGQVAVELLNGFIPNVNASFTVMSFGGRSGTFTNYHGLNVGFGRYFTPTYNSSSFVLQAADVSGPNNAPSLSPISDKTIYEGTTITFTNAASDVNGDQVLYALVSAPTNAVLGITNGIFSWTPTEAQGGSSHVISLRAFDSGSPSLSTTQSFTIVVSKTNSAPVLPQIGSQLIGVDGTLTVTNAATDSDLPVQTLTYAIVSAPSGVNVNASSGVITWSPTNSGSFQVTMRVSDNGSPALSATNTFIISVLSKPTPPSGLVSWWTGDGTTSDRQGLNEGALSGTASYAPGLYGQAFNFNGGYLTVLNSASLSFAPTNALSVEMWVKRIQPGYPAYYFGKRVGCGTYNYQSPSDQISGGFYDPPVGEWRHFVWVFTGSEWHGYVNGTLVYRTDTTLGPENSAALFIGSSGTCNQPFVGLIDEARLYNRALTSNEVATVYAGQSFGPPVITQQPANQKVAAGTTAILTASASGLAPFNYQWRFNGAPLVGKTDATLTLNNVTLAQSGSYNLVVSNAHGTTFTLPAELAVMQAPSISIHPQTQTAAVGNTVTLSVIASGTGNPSLSYQWRKGGVAISGGTDANLVLNNVQTTDSGIYDVLVYNWIASSVSAPATLTVTTPIVWTGSVSSYWTNSTNWNPATVPTSNDTVVVSTAGTVILPTNSQFAVLNFYGGTMTGPVTVRSNAVFNWYAGRLGQGSSLLVQSNGLLNLTSGGQKELGGATTNYGEVKWTGGNLYLMNDGGSWQGTVTNIGLWQMQGDLGLHSWFGNGLDTFANGSIFRKTAGAGVGVVSVPFLNKTGTLEVQTGTLRFDRGQTLDGLFVAQTGSAIQFNSGTFNYTQFTQLTGGGQYLLTGGTFLGLPDYLPNLQLLGGNVGLSPTYQTNGTIVRLDLNGANLIGAYQISGVLNFNAGLISSAITIASNGVLNWNSGRFAPGSSLVVQSNGLVNLQNGGQKELGGIMTNSGSVIWTGGNFYMMNNSADYLGSIVNLGLWQMQGDFGIYQWFGGDASLFVNGGTFRKSSGTGTGVISAPFLNQYGVVESLSGSLRFDRGQQLDGLFIAGIGAAIDFRAGAFVYTSLTRFSGAGQFYFSGGTLSGLPAAIPNFNLVGGTVFLSPAFQTNGVIANLTLNGASLGGTNTVVGSLNLTGGSITGPLTIASNASATLSSADVYGSVTVTSNAVLNWFSGRFYPGSGFLVLSNGLLNMSGGGQKELGTGMTNFGTVIWNGGSFYLMNNNNSSYFGNVTNAGVWEIQGNMTMGQWFGGDTSTFRNGGILRRSTGTGTLTVNVPILNSGSLETLSGLMTLNGGLSSTGGGAKFGITSNDVGRISVSGTVPLTGSLSAVLLDGFIPATNASYQVMTFGARNGVFNDISGLNTGFGRTFITNYTATTLTLLASLANGANQAPVPTTLGPNYSIYENVNFSLPNSASDPDGNQILFALISGPINAAVDLNTGLFTWSSPETPGGTNTTNAVSIRVFDNGSPSLSATQTFNIIVVETNSAPVLPQIPQQLVGMTGTLTVTNTAVDSDLPANTLTYTLLSAPVGSSISASGIVTWSPSSPGTFQFTTRVADNGTPVKNATNTFTVTVIPKPTPLAGLVSSWTGDGTPADFTGTNHAALTGNASYGAGMYGQAFYLTGGWLTVLHSPSLSFASGTAMSFEMWGKRTGGSAPIYFFGKRAGCGAYNYQSPSEQISGGFYDPPVGEWRHYVWVYTGTKWQGYVNGALVYQNEASLGAENLMSLFIGFSGTCGNSFVGLIDEARLYNRALQPNEVTTLYSGQFFGPAMISKQPASQWVKAGTTAVLQSGAYGLNPLSYQWRFNGAVMAGQMGSTLTLNNVTTAQTGDYYLIASNSLGMATSQVASLAVIQPPSITNQPVGSIAIVGSSISLSVGATGTLTPTLSYQWRRSGTNLVGETSPTLLINNVQVSHAGNYDVIVANWAGAVTSSVATLTVNTPIVWTGLSSTDWHNTNNWNPKQIPTSTDTAVINSGTVVATTNSQFLGLNFNGGTLYGPLIVKSNCLLSWSAGRLHSSVLLQSNATMTLSGTAQKELAGAITNFGQVNWSSGTLYMMNDGGSFQATVTNIGLWQMQGDLNLGSWFANGLDTFANGGVFRKTLGAGIGIISVPFLNRTGTLDVQTGTLRFDRGQTLDGSFIAQAGTLIQFNSGTFNYTALTSLGGSGQYSLTGGTLLGLLDYLPNLQLFGGSVGLAPTYQTNGSIVRLDLNGAALIGSNRVSGALNMNSGFVTGPLVVKANGTLNWNSGRFTPGSSLTVETNGLVNLQTGGQKELGGGMTNYGSVIWTGGNFYMMNNAADYLGTIVNFSLWQMQGDFFLGQWFGGDASVFNNAGVFLKSAGTGVGVISAPVLNAAGTVDVQTGTLRFDQGMQLNGLFYAANGAAMDFHGGTFTYTAQTQLTGLGTYYLSGGQLQNLLKYQANFLLVGGTVNLSPTFQTNGVIVRLDLNGATLAGTNIVVGLLNVTNGAVTGPLTVGSNGVFNMVNAYTYASTIVASNGVMNWYGGRFAPGSSLLVQSNALLNMLSGNQKELGVGMTNLGRVTWSGGSFYLMNNSADYRGIVTNAGLWELENDGYGPMVWR